MLLYFSLLLAKILPSSSISYEVTCKLMREMKPSLNICLNPLNVMPTFSMKSSCKAENLAKSETPSSFMLFWPDVRNLLTQVQKLEKFQRNCLRENVHSGLCQATVLQHELFQRSKPSEMPDTFISDRVKRQI